MTCMGQELNVSRICSKYFVFSCVVISYGGKSVIVQLVSALVPKQLTLYLYSKQVLPEASGIIRGLLRATFSSCTLVRYSSCKLSEVKCPLHLYCVVVYVQSENKAVTQKKKKRFLLIRTFAKFSEVSKTDINQ